MSNILLIVILLLLIQFIYDKGYFGENKSESNIGRYTSQANILAKSNVGAFKDATELS
jgi:hypothetical protein